MALSKKCGYCRLYKIITLLSLASLDNKINEKKLFGYKHRIQDVKVQTISDWKDILTGIISTGLIIEIR